MAVISDPLSRYWRTDLRVGRNVYACLSNDPTVPSENDPLIGVMESSSAAEDIVNLHNGALRQFGRRYQQAISDVKAPNPDGEISLSLTASERRNLSALMAWLYRGFVEERLGPLEVTRWLHEGVQMLMESAPLRRGVDKLGQALEGSHG